MPTYSRTVTPTAYRQDGLGIASTAYHTVFQASTTKPTVISGFLFVFNTTGADIRVQLGAFQTQNNNGTGFYMTGKGAGAVGSSTFGNAGATEPNSVGHDTLYSAGTKGYTDTLFSYTNSTDTDTLIIKFSNLVIPPGYYVQIYNNAGVTTNLNYVITKFEG